LHPNLQKKVKEIMNGPGNMALIPASINQSVRYLSCWLLVILHQAQSNLFQKGQLIKHGMDGKQIKRNNARDEYAKQSYSTAHKTAGELDKALKEVSLSYSD
jgi:hypothetical protein